MSDPQVELRERIAVELAMHYRIDGWTSTPNDCACGGDFDGFTTWRRHIADAVLAALGLEQVGWLHPENLFPADTSPPTIWVKREELLQDSQHGSNCDRLGCAPVYRLSESTQ